MADTEVKARVLASLGKLANAIPGRDARRPLVEGETLHEVKGVLALTDLSCTAIGAALRSLHNAGKIRCARPRPGKSEPRPYAVYLYQPFES